METNKKTLMTRGANFLHSSNKVRKWHNFCLFEFHHAYHRQANCFTSEISSTMWLFCNRKQNLKVNKKKGFLSQVLRVLSVRVFSVQFFLKLLMSENIRSFREMSG